MMNDVEDINKKLISYFGTPFSKKEHLTNLTFSALSIAIYGTNELDKNQNEHIVWLTDYCIKKFYTKNDLEIQDIIFLHKNIVQKGAKSIFFKDGKELEIKEIQRGKFRKINTYLNYQGHKINFIDFREIEKELHEIINDFNFSSKNVKDISKMLLEGVRVHPFMDGNGKTFRALFDLLLIKNNYYPSLFNLSYKTNKLFFIPIFPYYSHMDKTKGLENFLDSLADVYKVSYFSTTS